MPAGSISNVVVNGPVEIAIGADRGCAVCVDFTLDATLSVAVSFQGNGRSSVVTALSARTEAPWGTNLAGSRLSQLVRTARATLKAELRQRNDPRAARLARALHFVHVSGAPYPPPRLGLAGATNIRPGPLGTVDRAAGSVDTIDVAFTLDGRFDVNAAFEADAWRSVVVDVSVVATSPWIEGGVTTDLSREILGHARIALGAGLLVRSDDEKTRTLWAAIGRPYRPGRPTKADNDYIEFALALDDAAVQVDRGEYGARFQEPFRLVPVIDDRWIDCSRSTLDRYARVCVERGLSTTDGRLTEKGRALAENRLEGEQP